ncbi:MAG: HdeD family acid-resistance protein [Anaerolineae bacterium]|nr:HdeD family acid-resistance protein [Anaerolineae bacterium]
MITNLARNWWALVLRGIFALIFGIIAIVWPGLTILSLTFVFGFYALLDGIFALAATWSNHSHERWWLLLIEGLLSLAAGVVAFIMPGVTALALLTVIAVWAVLTGILEIVAAVRLRQEMQNEVWLGLAGLASIIFGVLLVVWPGAGLVTISWIVGFYAVIFGLAMMVLGFRLRGMNNTVMQHAAGTA